jgi:hypothetical protein
MATKQRNIQQNHRKSGKVYEIVEDTNADLPQHRCLIVAGAAMVVGHTSTFCV